VLSVITSVCQLEGNIRDQVELHRSDVIHDLERFDVEHKEWVTLKVLRKVIERHAVAVTDEHFSELVAYLYTGLSTSSTNLMTCMSMREVLVYA